MLYQILLHTPHWVWGVLAALLWLGLAQSAPRRARLQRVVLLPLAMTAFSVYNLFSGFSPMVWSWVLWAGAALATAAWFASADLPAGVAYDSRSRMFSLPGSWAPLVFMVAIFLTRYVVGVALAMHPAWAHDESIAAIVSSIYGALSGVFIGRMLRLLRKARENNPAPPEGPGVAWG